MTNTPDSLAAAERAVQDSYNEWRQLCESAHLTTGTTHALYRASAAAAYERYAAASVALREYRRNLDTGGEDQ